MLSYEAPTFVVLELLVTSLLLLSDVMSHLSVLAFFKFNGEQEKESTICVRMG